MRTPCEPTTDGKCECRVLLDSVYLMDEQTEPMIQRIAELTHTELTRIVVTHSHSHAAGHFEPWSIIKDVMLLQLNHLECLHR